MIRLTVQFIKETKNYAYYETPAFDMVFRSNQFAVKLWIPKSELNVQTDEPTPAPYPPFIEVGILDDTDKEGGPGVREPVPAGPRDLVQELIERATRQS